MQLASETMSQPRLGEEEEKTDFSVLPLQTQVTVFLPSSPIPLFLLSQVSYAEALPLESVIRGWFLTQYLRGLYKKGKSPVFWNKEWEVSSCHVSEESSVMMSGPHSSDGQRLAEPGEK